MPLKIRKQNTAPKEAKSKVENISENQLKPADLPTNNTPSNMSPSKKWFKPSKGKIAAFLTG